MSTGGRRRDLLLPDLLAGMASLHEEFRTGRFLGSPIGRCQVPHILHVDGAMMQG